MSITIEIELPDALADFQLPAGLSQRLATCWIVKTKKGP